MRRNATAALLAGLALTAVGCGGGGTVASSGDTPVDEVALSCIDTADRIHGEVTDIEAGLHSPRATLDGSDPYVGVGAHVSAAQGMAAELTQHPDGVVAAAAAELADELADLDGSLGTVTAELGRSSNPSESGGPDGTQRSAVIDGAVGRTRDAVTRLYESCPSVRNAP